jgi:hypothetical protein
MKLYTVTEAAAETGLSAKAIRRRIEKETILSMVRNGRRLIPQSELDRIRAEIGLEGQSRAAFPPDEDDEGMGGEWGSSGGMMLEPIVRELAETREHVERLAREAEREKLTREQAELREASEREAKEAAQAESLELRARTVELESVLRAAGINDSGQSVAAVRSAAEIAAMTAELEHGAEGSPASGEGIEAQGEGVGEKPVPATPSRLARFLGIG